MISFRRAIIVCFLCTAFAQNAEAIQSVPEQIEQAARAQLERQAAKDGLVEPRFELVVVANRPPPPCAQPVAVEALDTRQPARMRFLAHCPDAGGWRYEYMVRSKVAALVAVSAGTLPANATLTADAVALERRDISNVADPISNPQAAARTNSRRLK